MMPGKGVTLFLTHYLTYPTSYQILVVTSLVNIVDSVDKSKKMPHRSKKSTGQFYFLNIAAVKD